MAGLSVSSWGDPNATKRVLLIHGITSSSLIWGSIAQAFTSKGYLVIAPDLLGHGNARRGSDYTIAALVEELQPLFATAGGDDPPYHIVIGHSLGGVVATFLLPLLKSTRPVHVVLVDPPLQQSPEMVARFRKLCGDEIRQPSPPEAILLQSPHWTREVAVARYAGQCLCDVSAIEAIFDQNVPWSFADKLSTAPDNVKLTVLVADPAKGPCARVEELEPYSHVTAKTVWGASHPIHVEFPQVVVETAVEGAELPN